jgi:hypothetical protein
MQRATQLIRDLQELEAHERKEVNAIFNAIIHMNRVMDKIPALQVKQLKNEIAIIITNCRILSREL